MLLPEGYDAKGAYWTMRGHAYAAEVETWDLDSSVRLAAELDGKHKASSQAARILAGSTPHVLQFEESMEKAERLEELAIRLAREENQVQWGGI